MGDEDRPGHRLTVAQCASGSRSRADDGGGSSPSSSREMMESTFSSSVMAVVPVSGCGVQMSGSASRLNH